MKRKSTEDSRSKILLIILTAVCAVLIGLSLYAERYSSGPVHQVTGYILTPIQSGISSIGEWLSSFSGNFADSATLRQENAALQEKVDTLTAENSQLIQEREELSRIRELLELDQQYPDYEKVGARVISKDTGNWFSSFTINKGSNDGISVDCNVIAGSGLVGIVTEVGPNWAKIRSIIDDDSSVSAMISTTSDFCIVAGDLRLIDNGTIQLVKLTDEKNKVHVGDKVVTSTISEKFLPGILIGYISELNNDSNNLTKSGSITPVVDFRHLQEVLVILEKKNYVITDSSQVPETDAQAETAGERETQQTEDGELLQAPRTEE